MKKEWMYIFSGGFLEVFWALSLKKSQGFSQPLYSVITIVLVVISFYLFSKGMNVLPSGVAYTVFTGIGAIGTIILGVVLLGKSISLQKVFFSGILILSIILLKRFTTENELMAEQKEE